MSEKYVHEGRRLQRDSRIEAAAIIWKEVLYVLPRPARHCDIVHHIHQKTGDMNIFGEQGFVDQYGTFIRRKPAMMVAQRAGQILKDRPIHGHDLYSENVW